MPAAKDRLTYDSRRRTDDGRRLDAHCVRRASVFIWSKRPSWDPVSHTVLLASV
jgi:hypothetical protein